MNMKTPLPFGEAAFLFVRHLHLSRIRAARSAEAAAVLTGL